MAFFLANDNIANMVYTFWAPLFFVPLKARRSAFGSRERQKMKNKDEIFSTQRHRGHGEKRSQSAKSSVSLCFNLLSLVFGLKPNAESLYFIFSFDIRYSIVQVFDILFCLFSVSLCFSLLSLVFGLKPNAESQKPGKVLTMVKSNPFQHTVSKVFHIPGTAGLFRTVGCSHFATAVHRERTVFCTLFRSHSRSGRRGRMQRHMRDNMASRENGPGKPISKGGRIKILCRWSCPPISSPGVCNTNPPIKPTGKFYRPNRQWCGARRGGGEGSPRARVSFKQQERIRFNPSAIFCAIADRQQRGRSSGHRRAASSTARTRVSRIMDLLDMKKRYDFHIRAAQQNMGTGNALFQRCLYPFLRPLEFFNRSVAPLCKTVRARGAFPHLSTHGGGRGLRTALSGNM